MNKVRVNFVSESELDFNCSANQRMVFYKSASMNVYNFRHLVNLSSDLLTTPDIYWNRKKHEQLYETTCNFLNIYRRTRVSSALPSY